MSQGLGTGLPPSAMSQGLGTGLPPSATSQGLGTGLPPSAVKTVERSNKTVANSATQNSKTILIERMNPPPRKFGTWNDSRRFGRESGKPKRERGKNLEDRSLGWNYNQNA
jgi:hypothetical protein